MSPNETILQNKFNDEYNRAGLQVRNVVDSIDGLIQVIAPPAAAITATLALRIAKILIFTGTKAENIYWFTSTNSSAIAIKNKLVELIGAAANGINIHSFQSFCENVILQHGALFENNSMQPVTTLERIQLLKKLIARFPKDHPLKTYRSDVYHEISRLQMLFSFMKREGFTSRYLIQKMDDFLPELLGKDETNAGFQSDLYSNKTMLIEKMRAGITGFDHYQNLLQENYRYDDDMINLVLKAFEEDNNLLSEYREKIEYIQVDNDALSIPAGKLLQMLADRNKHSNFLKVVYDQPINPLQEQTTWDDSCVFGQTQTTHWKTIKLDYNSKYKPTITSYNSVHEEMSGIVNHVYKLLQQNIVANKIAIIYLQDGFGSAMEQYLIAKRIPFYTRQNINVLEQPFIKKIIQLLRYISTELDTPFSGDDLLFEILHFDFYKIPPYEISKLTVEVYNKKYSKTPMSIRKLLRERANAPAKDLFDTGLNKNLKDASNILEKIIGEASNSSLLEIFENIIRHTEVSLYVDQSRDRTWLMQLLAALTHFIKTETDRNPRLKLNELIAVIDTIEKASLPLHTFRIKGNENDVQLIKASEAIDRKCKYVFITGANAVTPSKDDWLKGIFNLPGIIPHLHSNYFEYPQEALHPLFYTMLAGNADHLFISFAKYNDKGNPLVPAEAIAGYIAGHSIQINHKVLIADELSDYGILDKVKFLPEIAHPEEAFIAPILKKFVMNVSALNSYLKCPLGFYYKNMLRVPYGKSEAMEFGSAIHYALENLFKKMSLGVVDGAHGRFEQLPFPLATTMVDDFNWYMQSRRTYFTRETYERRLQYGSDVLQNYYNQYINSWNKVVSVERNIRGKTTNGVPIKGKTDKLEFYGREVIIVDYKSGDIEKALPKMDPPNAINPTGGDYWRQAVFYKILVDNYEQKGWKVIGVEFDFVEPDEKDEYRKIRIEITPADTATVTHQITEAWNKIQAHNFYTGCGRPDCHWCNFVKNNNLAVTLHETEIADTAN